MDDVKGVEIFSGTVVFTSACRASGIPMAHPFDILYGSHLDAFERRIDVCIRTGRYLFVWLPLQVLQAGNLDVGGALRPPGNPEGDPQRPGVTEGNRLWYQAVDLALLCLWHTVPFCIEHSRK